MTDAPAPARARRRAARPLVPLLVFALSVLVFGAAQAKIWKSKLRVSGDEPHVLMTVVSLVRDGDLGVANNYQRGDYRDIGRRGLIPQVAPVKGYIPPEKGIGFPALLVPIYALLGVIGTRLFVIAFAALVLPLLYWNCVTAGLSRTSASLACLGLSVCLPWEVHAHLILPEVVAGATLMLIVAAFLHFELTGKRWPALAIGVLTLALPVVYLKYSALAVASGVLLLSSRRLRSDWLVYASAPLAVLYGMLWVSVYGWSISIGTGAGPHDFHSREILTNIGNAFFDRDHGLVTRAPIALLALLGLFVGPRRGYRVRLYCAAAVVAYAVLYGLTSLRPGDSAPGRYLVASMPAYSALAAFGLLFNGRFYRVRVAVYVVFVAVTATFLVTAIAQDSFGLPDWYLSLFPKRYYQ